MPAVLLGRNKLYDNIEDVDLTDHGSIRSINSGETGNQIQASRSNDGSIRNASMSAPCGARGEVQTPSGRLQKRGVLSMNRRSTRFGWNSLKPEVIYADNRYLKAWSHFILVLSFYSACVTPLEFGFHKGTGLPLWWELFDIGINMFFVADLLLSFCLTYKDPKTHEIVDDHKLIVKRYLRTEFVPDLLACMPWDSIYKATGRLEGFRYFNWFKIYRVRKVKTFFSKLEKDTRYNYLVVRITRLVVVEVYYTHVAACIFYYLATTVPAAREADTWLGSLTLGGQSYANFRELSFGRRYCVSLYWAIITMVTLGYGDIHPVNPREMIFVMVFVSIDMLVTAYLIGNITAIIVRGSMTERFRDKMTGVLRYADRSQMPKVLKKQLKAHTALQYETQQQEETALLESFPPSLRARVLRAQYKELLHRSYLFDSCSTDFVNMIVSRLHVEYFFPGEVVIGQLDAGDQMYLICHGIVEEVKVSGGPGEGADGNGRQVEVVGELGPGELFGEVALLCSIPQPFSVRVKELAQLLRVEKPTMSMAAAIYAQDGQHVVSNLLQKSRDGDTQSEQLAAEITRLVDQQEGELATMFVSVASRGDLEHVKQLVKAGAKPSQADYDGRTPLHLASGKGFDDMCLFLLREGADVNAKDAFGVTPLLEALRRGHDSTAAILLEKGGAVSLSNAGTELCNAVMRGNVEYLDRLLEHGVDPDSGDYDGRTALHVASSEGFYFAAKLLLDRGADAFAQDRWGNMPVDEAYGCEHLPLVRLLEEAMRRQRVGPARRSHHPTTSRALLVSQGEAQSRVATCHPEHSKSPAAHTTPGDQDSSPDSADRAQRHTECSDALSGQVRRSGQPAESEESGQSRQAGQSGHSGHNGRPGRSGQAVAGQSGQNGQVGHFPQRRRPGQNEQAGQSGQPDQEEGYREEQQQQQQQGEIGDELLCSPGDAGMHSSIGKEPRESARPPEAPLRVELPAHTHALRLPLRSLSLSLSRVASPASSASPSRGGAMVSAGSPLLDMAAAAGALKRSKTMEPSPSPALPNWSNQRRSWGGASPFRRARVTLYAHHPFVPRGKRRAGTGQLVVVPDSIPELLEKAHELFGGDSSYARILHGGGGEVASVDLIQDGDRLFAVTEDALSAHYEYDNGDLCKHCQHVMR